MWPVYTVFVGRRQAVLRLIPEQQLEPARLTAKFNTLPLLSLPDRFDSYHTSFKEQSYS